MMKPLSKEEKKELTRKAMLEKKPTGVYKIVNNTNEKIFLGTSLNLDAKKSSEEFKLNANSHKNKNLQIDWNNFGKDNFSYEIVALYKIKDDDDREKIKKELELMEKLWLEELEPFMDIEKGYHKRPI